jgi:hypothetical protein
VGLLDGRALSGLRSQRVSRDNSPAGHLQPGINALFSGGSLRFHGDFCNCFTALAGGSSPGGLHRRATVYAPSARPILRSERRASSPSGAPGCIRALSLGHDHGEGVRTLTRTRSTTVSPSIKASSPAGLANALAKGPPGHLRWSDKRLGKAMGGAGLEPATSCL